MKLKNSGQALIEFVVVIPIALAFSAFFYEVTFLEFKKVMCFQRTFSQLRNFRNSSSSDQSNFDSQTEFDQKSTKLTSFNPAVDGEIVKVSAKCEAIAVDLQLPFLTNYKGK